MRRKTKDEDERRTTKDEGRKTKDEGRRTKDGRRKPKADALRSIVYGLLSIVSMIAFSFDSLNIRKLHLQTIKFLALPPSERWLLIQAALLVGAARLGLWLLPFRVLPSVLKWLAWLIAWRTSTPVAPERIAWAVVAVSSYVPVSTCLTQALAARALLARQGCPAQLRIGVARAAHGQLQAHAWVEVDQHVILGGSISGRYIPLPSIEIER